MKTNEKVINLGAAKKLSYLDDLNIREAEEARLRHMRALQKNPPSKDMVELANSLSNPDAFDREFDIFNSNSPSHDKQK